MRAKKTALDNRIGMLIGGSTRACKELLSAHCEQRLNGGTPVDAVANLVGIVESIEETRVLRFVESADDAGTYLPKMRDRRW